MVFSLDPFTEAQNHRLFVCISSAPPVVYNVVLGNLSRPVLDSIFDVISESQSSWMIEESDLDRKYLYAKYRSFPMRYNSLVYVFKAMEDGEREFMGFISSKSHDFIFQRN